METIFTLAEIDEVAVQLISLFFNHKIVTLNGEMGAGKTTLIQAICKQMGVREKMSSPTYSIIQQYLTADELLVNHIDIYRLNDLEEAIQAGVQEAINSGDYCFIEWPEKIANLLPLHFISIFISPVDRTQRRLVANIQ